VALQALGGPALLQVASRDQRTMRVLAVAEDGTVERICEDTDPAWVNVVIGTPAWTAGGQLVRVIARDGAYRLMIGGWLGTLVGIAVFLFFSHRIPGGQAFPAYIVAIGVALMCIGLMGRRGYVKAGAISPGLIVLGIGVVEVLLAANLLPSGFLPFVLSFWFPGIGLVLAGLFYLAITGMRSERR